MIIGFPGRGESAEQFVRYSDIDQVNAVAIVAQGLPGTNGESSWQGTPFANPRRNDLAFVVALENWAARSGCVSNTVTLTGKSDGGGFAEWAACHATVRATAVVAVSAAFYASDATCNPGQPVTFVSLHGSADPVVPFDGSPTRHLLAQATIVDQWAATDRCQRTSTSNNSDVTLTRWTDCADSRSVSQYRLAGDGHTWAGASTRSGPGATNTTVSATHIIEQVTALGD